MTSRFTLPQNSSLAAYPRVYSYQLSVTPSSLMQPLFVSLVFFVSTVHQGSSAPPLTKELYTFSALKPEHFDTVLFSPQSTIPYLSLTTHAAQAAQTDPDILLPTSCHAEKAPLVWWHQTPLPTLHPPANCSRQPGTHQPSLHLLPAPRWLVLVEQWQKIQLRVHRCGNCF